MTHTKAYRSCIRQEASSRDEPKQDDSCKIDVWSGQNYKWNNTKSEENKEGKKKLKCLLRWNRTVCDKEYLMWNMYKI